MNSPSQRDHELVMLFRSITGLYSAKEYDKVIDRVQALIEEGTFSHEQLDPFVYYMAASLDICGRTTDALPLFAELLERLASNTSLSHSVQITGRGMASLASELYHKRPESKELENFESVMLSLSSAPLWLRMHLAKRKARAGDHAYAKNLCESYLALSPNDGDYLRHSVEIAQMIADEKWLKKLRVQIGGLSKEQPYRLDLIALLADVEASSEVA